MGPVMSALVPSWPLVGEMIEETYNTCPGELKTKHATMNPTPNRWHRYISLMWP